MSLSARPTPHQSQHSCGRHLSRGRGMLVKTLLGASILSLNLAFSCVESADRTLVHDLEKKVAEASQKRSAIKTTRILAEKRENKEGIDRLLREVQDKRRVATEEDHAKAYADAVQRISDIDQIAKIETEDEPRDAKLFKDSVDDSELCAPEIEELPKSILCKYLKTFSEYGREPTDDELANVFKNAIVSCALRRYAPEELRSIVHRMKAMQTYKDIADAATTTEAAKRLLVAAACE